MIAIRPLVLVAAVVIAEFLASPVWAQINTPEKQNRWVLSYALVFLLLGLSLYSICRPSTRRKNG